MSATRRCVILATLPLLLVPARAQTPAAEPLRDADWFRIESHGASDADVSLARKTLGDAIAGLRERFGAETVDRLLTGIDCTVHLQTERSAETNEGMASLETELKARYRAVIRIFAPSASDPAFRSAANDPPGPDYFSKVLAHEYATILLERITLQKPSGWRFFQAPSWFVQGYEEYLGCMLSRPHNREVVLDRYVRQQADGSRVRFAFGVAVADPYVDGAVLLHFMHETFGAVRVQSILTRPERTFEDAITAALGVDLAQFAARWDRWRARALGTQAGEPQQPALHPLAWIDAVWSAETPAAIAEAVVGQDLKKLPKATMARVLTALRKLAGKDEYWQEPGDGSPHLLIRCDRGATRWALFVTYEGMTVPGYSWMAVHQFDAGWKQTSVDRFATGYRLALFDVWQEAVPALGEPAVVVRLGSIGSFGNYSYRQREYYVLRDGRALLVRIEEEGKDVVRGDFAAQRPWTGPVPVKRSADEWIATLGSADPALVLETLTWLGGNHLPSTRPRDPQVNQETTADAKLWETVRDDPRTRQKLTELAQSKNAWLQAAAALVVRGD